VSNSGDFQLIRCIINSVTGDFTCVADTPRSFDVAWVTDGLETVLETTNRVELVWVR
jgi:hypothetical protein